jgi:nickel transport protein
VVVSSLSQRVSMHRLLAFLCAIIFAGPAAAHDLGATTKVRDGRVELEAYFDDDKPARGAQVVVNDLSGNVIAQGRTDQEGRWSFAVPGQASYEITVDAGDGHRVVVSSTRAAERPSRTQFTRTPWVKIGLGLGLIALGAFGLQAALRRSRQAKDEAANRASSSSPAHPSPPGPT